MNPPSSHPVVRRNRGMLLLIVAIFFGSLLGAGVLRFSGWQPAGMKNHGELLQPPTDLRAITPHLADGTAYHWQPLLRLWRITLAPPTDCIEACIALMRDLDKVRQLTGQDADRVQVLWIGTPPAAMPHFAAVQVLQRDPTLLARLPRLRTNTGKGHVGGGGMPLDVPVYVIDPNGFVVLRYAPGFDPGGLRADLSKLLKLM